MKNILLLLTVFIIGCQKNGENIELSKTYTATLNITEMEEERSLSSEEINKFVKSWNNRDKIGPCKFYPHYVLRLNSKNEERVFWVSKNGEWVIEKPSGNNGCYEINKNFT